MRRERGAGSGTVRGRNQRCSGGNASARTGTIGVLSVRKKYGARNVKLRNGWVLVGADTDLSWATLRAASASLGGVAGAVPPPHAASSTGKTAVHANNGLLGTRHMAASGAVAGTPQDWYQGVRVLDGTSGGAGGLHRLHTESRSFAPAALRMTGPLAARRERGRPRSCSRRGTTSRVARGGRSLLRPDDQQPHRPEQLERRAEQGAQRGLVRGCERHARRGGEHQAGAAQGDLGERAVVHAHRHAARADVRRGVDRHVAPGAHRLAPLTQPKVPRIRAVS